MNNWVSRMQCTKQKAVQISRLKNEWCDSSDHYPVHTDACAGKDFLLSPEERLAASMDVKSPESGAMK